GLDQGGLARDLHSLTPGANGELDIDALYLINLQRVRGRFGGFETIALHLDLVGADRKFKGLIIAFLVGCSLVFHPGSNGGNGHVCSRDERALLIGNRTDDSCASALAYQRRTKGK